MRVIELASSAGHDVDVARAWRRLSSAQRRVGAYSAAEEAARNALRHARRARSRQEEARAADALANCLLYGPTPALEARAVCTRLLETDGRTRTLEANVTGVISALEAMLGEFETARRSYGRAAALLDELGHELARAALTQIGAPLELLAGDPVAAELEARRGAAIYERYGSSTVQVPLVAEALHAQLRYDEAASVLATAPLESGPQFAQWQVRWRIVAARLAGVAGDGGGAVASAEVAVARAMATDDITLRGDATAALADALAADGRHDAAAEAGRAALDLYRAKGNLAAAAALSKEAHLPT
jgi:tetratricopeptide (TPR) repeat protein